MIKKLLLPLLLCCALTSLGHATITRVQSKTANSGASSVSTLDVVLDAAPTAGNVVVVAAATVAGGSGVAAIAPSSGITWVQLFTEGASSTSVSLFVGRVFSGASATITVTANSGGIALAAAEYSGVSNKFDRSAAATGSSTSAASGATSTTGVANELWIAAIGHRITSGATFSSPTNSFAIVGQDKTSIASVSDRSVALLERIVSATGAANAGATISSSGVWVSQVLTLEETTSAGGSFPFCQ